MLGGVLIVTLFSDPMVTVLNEISNLIFDVWGFRIPPFYISFLITPLASNASELITSVIFARKKTQKSITLTYSQLLGAAIMNNTFVLSIFLCIVYFKAIAWEFSAEVTCIMVVELLIGIIALSKVYFY